MDLKIESVEKGGDLSKEYVWINAVKDCDLKYYMVADSTFTSEGYLSNKLRHTYWFIGQEVKAGDHVMLLTCPGKDQAVKNSDGSTTYIVCWGLKSSVWNNTGDAAVLIHTPEWETNIV